MDDKMKKLLPSLEKPFAEFRSARERVAADPKLVENVLRDGAEKARAEARATLKEVRRAMRLS